MSKLLASGTKLLPSCSSTVFLDIGGNHFPPRKRITDHMWNILVLPFINSTKVCQLFYLAHLVRLCTSWHPRNHWSPFLENIASQEICLLMPTISAGVIQHWSVSWHGPYLHDSWQPQGWSHPKRWPFSSETTSSCGAWHSWLIGSPPSQHFTSVLFQP
jgi:hypothetical protein